MSRNYVICTSQQKDILHMYMVYDARVSGFFSQWSFSHKTSLLYERQWHSKNILPSVGIWIKINYTQNTLNCTVSVLTYMTRGNVSLLDLRRWPEIFIWLEVAEGWSRHKTRDAKYLKQANRKMTSPSVLLSALVLLMKPLMACCFLWTRLDNVTSQGKVMRVGVDIFVNPFIQKFSLSIRWILMNVEKWT